MKIVDFRCTLIGPYPVLRLVTDVGIDGFSQAESSKGDNPGAVNIVPQVMVYKPMVLGCDPTDVQRVVEQIRRMGGFKPWGAAVSMIEVACLDIAGKALGCPVYKLLGGKVRDRVRVYNGNLRPPIAAWPESWTAWQSGHGGDPSDTRRSAPDRSCRNES